MGWFFIVVCALAIPMLIYGSTRCSFLSTPCLSFCADALSGGIALHSLMDGKLRYSIVLTATVGIMFGALFMWLLG
ncbi:DUF3561 family protein [Shigella sonnei]